MKYFTLLQLNKSIQNLLHGIDRNFWITAEVAQFQLREHVYLELVQKEEDRIVARSRAMVWAAAFNKLKEKIGDGIFEILKEGSEVLIQVKVTFHELHGLSLNVLDVDETYTIGALELKRRETLDKLTSEGILDRQKLLTFPLVPQRIAVISSKEAAGFIDFVEQLSNNQYHFNVRWTLFETKVQGQNALKEIITKLLEIDINEFEVIVIIRGGGSRLDLEIFNEYNIANAIAKINIPVLTGIGHQKDETVSDIVAYKALKTPTAVAEFLIDRLYDFWLNINEVQFNITQLSKKKLESNRNTLILLQQQIINHAKFNLNSHSIRLVELQKSIQNEIGHKLTRENNELNNLERQIRQLDPKRLLERGYSITLKNGLPLSDKNPVALEDEIESITNSGKIISKVIKKDEENN